MTNRCDACLDGEHFDYDDDVRRVSIYEAGMFLRRESLCGHHREAMAEDGYDLRAPRAVALRPVCPSCGDDNVTDDREPCFACLEDEALAQADAATACATCGHPPEAHRGLMADLTVNAAGMVFGPCLNYEHPNEAPDGAAGPYDLSR